MNWTISETIITAAIGGFCVIVAALINARGKRKDEPAKSPVRESISQTVHFHLPDPNRPRLESNSALGSSVSMPERTISQSGEASTVPHEKMMEGFEKLTPFRQAAIRKQYIGMVVRWSARLDSIGDLTAGKKLIGAKLSRYVFLQATVAENNLAQLFHVEAGGRVEIEGRITEISVAYVELDDAVVRVITS